MSRALIARPARTACVAALAALLAQCGPVREERDGAFMADAAADSALDAATEREASALDGGATDAADAGEPTLEVRVFRVPDNTPDEALYLACDRNGWRPDDPAMRLARDGATYVVRVAGVRAGAQILCKFTRGSWATVERTDRGDEQANRSITFDPAHPIVAMYVERWADRAAPSSTRSGSIRSLGPVQIPQLGRTREAWVYLPPGYEGTSERYPVLYLYDGQNVFDARTAAFGREWAVDEALEALFYERRLGGVIAVAVANGEAERPCEYNVFAADPHPGCASGAALGDGLNAFYAEVLKPRIDRDFRSDPDRTRTAIMGSSMGGSMATRLGWQRSTVFSRVAALSPSYQNTLTARAGMPDFVRGARPERPFRFHQDMGSAEQIRELSAGTLIANMNAVRDAARTAGLGEESQRAVVVDGAVHNEDAWAARVRSVIAWLFQ
jgi:predicted alpha/beta superfamily hydrolase